MKTYRMTLMYDGSAYQGWQKLGQGEKTIQACVEKALEEILGYKTEVQASGRTDAGVHARGQEISLKMKCTVKPDFQTKLNRILPEDIKVLRIEEMQQNFHARYQAIEKRYCYYVDTNEKPNVFQRKYMYHFPYAADVYKMQKAAEYLVGTHDFTSFTDDKNKAKDKIRTIHKIHITQKNGCITFSYAGDGFLQHMVRILTGTLLEIGRGDKQSEDMAIILKQKERAKAGFTAPAKGLFLEQVKYKL